MNIHAKLLIQHLAKFKVSTPDELGRLMGTFQVIEALAPYLGDRDKLVSAIQTVRRRFAHSDPKLGWYAEGAIEALTELPPQAKKPEDTFFDYS